MLPSAEKSLIRLRSALQAALREVDTVRVVRAVCEEFGLDSVAASYIAAKISSRFSVKN